MRRALILSFISILFAAPVAAQIEETDLNFFNPYGSFRAHIALTGKSAAVENNSSRLGLMMISDTRSGWSLLARAEFGVNLVKNETGFYIDEEDDARWATL